MNDHPHPSLGGNLVRAFRLSSLAFCAAATASTLLSQDTDEVAGEVEDLVTYGGEDPGFVLPNQPIESAIGFSKSILETPRSVSVFSSEMIDSLSLSEVSDLSRVAPSTNTVTRWGVQGNIDIRNMTADTYFRGMKRIEPQGNSRTVLAANEQIEVVRGPAPSYFGAGKIGGYTNLIPKSGRARSGAFLTEDEGYVEITTGEYRKRVLTAGYGGPLQLGLEDLRGGYYVFGLVEDSDSFYTGMPVGQSVLQGSISQELPNRWRVEAGFNYQETKIAGGYFNRQTQEVVDDEMYWGGRPLVNLDADGSGKISQQEMVLGSPVGGVFGPANANNRDLKTRMYGTGASNGSRFTDALAGPIPTGESVNAFSALAALHSSNPDFVALMEADPAQYGNNLRLLNVLQQGFVFDPSTMRQTEANLRNVAIEKELFAKLSLFYVDFIYDGSESFTFKNQTLYDNMDQFKDSELPFYQKQDVRIIENKSTVEYMVPQEHLPEWLYLNTITSVNVRYSNGGRNSNTGDYDDRADLSLPGNVRTPYDLFITPRENDDYFNGGAPFTNDLRSKYWQYGLGSMLNLQIGERLDIITGGRVDYISIESRNPAGLYNVGTDGSFTTTEQYAKGNDTGFSYNASVSYRTPWNISPYATYVSQTALADSADLSIPTNIVEAGSYTGATLKEVGIKGSHFDQKLFWALSAYDQFRSSITEDVGGNPLLGGLGNIRGKGTELEVRWVPNRSFYVSAFSVFQITKLVDQGEWLRIHGEQLGFSDVVDPTTGEVIYPAEAFTWGGYPDLFVPADENEEVQGFPNTSHGVAFEYSFDNGISFGASSNYISETRAGRLSQVVLPEAVTFNLNVSYETEAWRLKVDMFNATDEQYYRGALGGIGGAMLNPMPGRRSQVTLTKRF